MIIIMIILALAISLLANVLLGIAQVTAKGTGDSRKPESDVPGEPAGTTPKEGMSPASRVSIVAAIPLVSALLGCFSAHAEDAVAGGATAASAASPLVNGISDTAFYFMAAVITLEVLVLLTLLYNLKLLLSLQKKEKTEAQGALQPAVKRVSWWDKINSFRPVEQEQDLDMGHDYDGIRELNNRMPPWWVYGFYCTILFACVYLWRYHVSHTAPLSGEEYQISMRAAEAQKAEYLKKAANSVDETTVKQLTDPGDLAAGKAVFETTCFACHGKSGEGGVGPNLTDDYWLHGGSIKDIFKTIKYGWPEKGMKSWKDDYSPSQIAQIASYIKSLHGTNPPNPKPPQGTLEK